MTHHACDCLQQFNNPFCKVLHHANGAISLFFTTTPNAIDAYTYDVTLTPEFVSNHSIGACLDQIASHLNALHDQQASRSAA